VADQGNFDCIPATVQTGIFCSALPVRAFIFVRKTLQVRPRDQKSVSFFKLAGKDLRFSMKMMLAPVPGASLHPV
jgi:hypothetical protein